MTTRIVVVLSSAEVTDWCVMNESETTPPPPPCVHIYFNVRFLFCFFFLTTLQFEVCRLAALLHRAADMIQPPTLKETKFLLPKPALMQNEVNPQQLVQMVQNNWPQIESLHSVEAKAQFLGT